MSDETPSKKLKLDVSSNGHAEGEEEEGEGGANQVVREEEVETDQEFVVATQDQENDEDLPDDEEEDDDFEEEEEGEEYMEEGGEEEEEETADHSNAKNIFAVKEITDLIFSGMLVMCLIAEDSSAGSPSPGEPRLNSNGAHTGSDPENSPGHSGGEDTSPPAQTHTPSRRGRKRKKFTLTMRKKGRKKKEVEEEEEEFPTSYLLSTGLPESDVEELKLGFTVLRDIMSQPCSDIFLCEPEMTEVADKIEYDQLIDKPMWLNLGKCKP
ncbi:histone acetyltransferase KAT6B-like [Diaphorina citri]|uniref:Histone acetyltransferase KAT6B-like n=1 Tax=Diaphorina citri TaxID=121845 RepID=A0A3Q0JHL4_DIACI|nr:histone acetyltransferase KAT6B-like [Diaphorina citri]